MRIANPIYDVIFKSLMEDTDIARELLSTILGVEIVSLTLKPQETTLKSENGNIRIFRLDFKSVIRLSDGTEKMVLIELQKAKHSDDVIRFRKYLGKNYEQHEKTVDEKGLSKEYSLEIVTIYFLGFELETVPVPILHIKRNYIDAVTGNEVTTVNEAFINHLTHESFTIQIPKLRLDQQNNIEQVLAVFSQKYVKDNLHVLDFTGNQTHPLVAKIVRRLLKAVSSNRMQRRMDAEDEIDRLFNRALAKNQKENDDKIKTIIEEKDSIIEEKDSIIEEKDSIIEEKEQENQRIRNENEEKERKIQRLEEKIKEMENLKEI